MTDAHTPLARPVTPTPRVPVNPHHRALRTSRAIADPLLRNLPGGHRCRGGCPAAGRLCTRRNSEAGPVPSKPVSTGIGSEPLTLKLLVTSGVDVPFYTALGKLFQAKHSNVTVKVENQDYATLTTTIARTLAGNNVPDLVRVPQLGNLTKDHLLISLELVCQGVRVGRLAAVAVRLHPCRPGRQTAGQARCTPRAPVSA